MVGYVIGFHFKLHEGMAVPALEEDIVLLRALADDVFTARRIIEQRLVGNEFITFFRSFQGRTEADAVVFFISGVVNALGGMPEGIIAAGDFTFFVSAPGGKQRLERLA